MPAIAQRAPASLGVDLDRPVTSRLLDIFDRTSLPLGSSILPYKGLNAGLRLPIRGIGRYVSLHSPEAAGDALASELRLMLARGYAVWLVQHVLNPGWEASGQLGSDLGGAARENALDVGYLPTCHLAIDVEGTVSKGDPVLEMIEAWAAEVTKSFPALCYVGYDNGLTPLDLYFGLGNVHLYWGAPGPWDVAERHFAVRQGLPITIGGAEVDPDGIGEDALGGALQWMVDPEKVGVRFRDLGVS
jgi:hypothetical protein